MGDREAVSVAGLIGKRIDAARKTDVDQFAPVFAIGIPSINGTLTN